MIRPLRNALKGFVSCITALLVTAAAFAGDSYPTRPIRLVVGFGAGGPTDIPARFIADRLASMLGQSVVVENKPGVGTNLAIEFVVRSAPMATLSFRALALATPTRSKALQDISTIGEFVRL